MHYCFFTVGSWDKNGAQLRLRDLGAALIRRGCQVSYLLDDLPHNRKMELHPQARRLWVPSPRTRAQFQARRRVLREANPDFVHMIAMTPKAYLATAGTNLKIIADWGEWPALRPYFWLRKRAEVFFDDWLRRRASLLVVASRYMQREFKRRFDADALYLPHAKHMPDQPDGPSLFAEPTAVYMGNFYPAYDHDILFDAAILLKKRGLVPRIELIADGPDLARWRQFVKDQSLENIILPGYLEGEALWRHLRHAHVLLFPLRASELNLCRCPGKTFFYAQAKRPVITTSVGEVPEVLKEKGTYVECTAGAFADAIASAMSNQNLPDIDYRLDTWDARAETLLSALSPIASSPARPVHAASHAGGAS
jgi:glycosyltransferase involved in cell wall biosynthesis